MLYCDKIKNLIEVNESLNSQTKNLNNLLEEEKLKFNNLLEQEKNKLIESEHKVNNYFKQINELEDKIFTLKKENNEKSSKTIWETTQCKIKERDDLIEELKKSLEFYKRKHTVLTGTNVEVKEIKETVKEIKEPVKEIKEPVKEIKEPVKEQVREPVKEQVREPVKLDNKAKLVKTTKIKQQRVSESIKIPDEQLEEKIINPVQTTKNPVQNKKKVESKVEISMEEELERELNGF